MGYVSFREGIFGDKLHKQVEIPVEIQSAWKKDALLLWVKTREVHSPSTASVIHHPKNGWSLAQKQHRAGHGQGF